MEPCPKKCMPDLNVLIICLYSYSLVTQVMNFEAVSPSVRLNFSKHILDKDKQITFAKISPTGLKYNLYCAETI